jgi:hypothetical protein
MITQEVSFFFFSILLPSFLFLRCGIQGAVHNICLISKSGYQLVCSKLHLMILPLSEKEVEFWLDRVQTPSVGSFSHQLFKFGQDSQEAPLLFEEELLSCILKI